MRDFWNGVTVVTECTFNYPNVPKNKVVVAAAAAAILIVVTTVIIQEEEAEESDTVKWTDLCKLILWKSPNDRWNDQVTNTLID